VIKTVLDVQSRNQETGRIRIGHTLVSQNGKPYPARLDTFRLTTPSRFAADQAAALFGGEPRPWEGHRGQFEVITTESEFDVTIPPKDGIFTMAYEWWKGGGILHRCNSQVQQDGQPCVCPHAADTTNDDEVHAQALERSRRAKLNPPQACSLITRISVMIPDLPIGVWRIDTKSFNAASVIGDQAEILEQARDLGIFLRAQLRIQQDSRVVDGQTTRFAFPVLTIIDSFRSIVSGELGARPVALQLPPAPGQAMAALPAGASALSQAALPAAPDPVVPLDSQEIADLVCQAASRAELQPLVDMVRDQRCGDDLILLAGSDVHEELSGLINARWSQVGQARAS
jgi:hypothetical protein